MTRLLEAERARGELQQAIHGPQRALRVAEQGYLAPLYHGAGSSCHKGSLCFTTQGSLCTTMFPPKLSSHTCMRREHEVKPPGDAQPAGIATTMGRSNGDGG
jgi:hypothetical protein